MKNIIIIINILLLLLFNKCNGQSNPCDIPLFGKTRRLSAEGLSGAICIFVGFITLALLVNWRNIQINKWQHVKFEKIPLIKHLTFKRSLADYYRMILLATDTLQIVAIILTANYAFNYWGQGIDEEGTGTTFELEHTQYIKNTNHIIKAVLSSFLLDFDEAAYLAGSTYNDAFWIVLSICVGIAFGFAMLCGIIYAQFDAAMGCNKTLSNIVVISGATMGQILFIPIMLNLFAPFACVQEYEITVGAYEQFPARDCTQTCWDEDFHLNYMLMALFALLCYVPCAIYAAPAWSIFHESVTLKDQPGYIMFTMIWKIFLCGAHSFLEQLPVAHSTAMFVLTGVLLLVTTWWRPTTLPYFDLVLIAVCALLFWCSVSMICGLFVREWVTICLLVIGGTLIIVEWIMLNSGKLGADAGKYAKDSIDYQRNQIKKKEEAHFKRIVLRRKLLLLAQHNNRVFMADNPRDVPRLVERDMYIDDIEEMFKKSKTTSAKALLDAADERRRLQDQRPMRVVGIHVKTPITSQVPLSYKVRTNDTGTLIVMRSPGMPLYKYLIMKINAYVAYHNAFYPHDKEAPTKIVRYTNENMTQNVQRKKRQSIENNKIQNNDDLESTDIYIAPYLTIIRGPSHTIQPEDIKITKTLLAKEAEYTPVNASKLLSIIQNSGQSKNTFSNLIQYHTRDMKIYLKKHHATHYTLGKNLCNLFKIKLEDLQYDPEINMGPKSRATRHKIDQHRRILENMEEEFKVLKQRHIQESYEKGKKDTLL